MIEKDNIQIGIIGLGYVGLPLAVAFAQRYPTFGFEINAARVAELKNGIDSSLEISSEELRNSDLHVTTETQDLKACNVYIVTVPTPIDSFKRPDLKAMKAASQSVGQLLSPGNFVVYESTVYPGATEEVCVPILEAESGLKFNKDFYVGYSPERINPGDKQHRVTNIVKVTSGSTTEATDFIDELYASIITAGTFKASSIKVAEAAKVIENTQRDVNIALINELALLFNRMEIDTLEVLQAAGTKWNFLPFRPGLVGGHCIGVDPYYLTHKAQAVGYNPEVILAGRRINDNMGAYVAAQVIKIMTRRRIQVVDSKILILGLSFKENCPDIRNTRVTDIFVELHNYNAQVEIYDPWADADLAKEEYQIDLCKSLKNNHYDAVILAVAHDQFKEMGIHAIRELCKPNGIVYDVKSVFPPESVDARL